MTPGPWKNDERLFLRDLVSKPFDAVTAIEFMALWSIASRAVAAPCDCYPEGNDGDCPAPGCGGSARAVIAVPWLPVVDGCAMIETSTADPDLTFNNAIQLPKHAKGWRPATI